VPYCLERYYRTCPTYSLRKNDSNFNKGKVGSTLRMSDVYKPPQHFHDVSHCTSMEQYRKMHSQSVEDPATFWGEIATKFHWKMAPTKENFLSYNFNVNNGPIEIKWMRDGKLNICYNALDRHLDKKGSQVAFYWEGNDPNDEGKITYNIA